MMGKKTDDRMLVFIKKAFRVLFSDLLWINLMVCTIIGAEISGNVQGGIIGAIVGVFIDIVGGGLIATFLELEKNIETLAKDKNNGSAETAGKNEGSREAGDIAEK